MSHTVRHLLLIASCVLPSCRVNDGPGERDIDASPPPVDAASPPPCISADVRARKTVEVRGAVVDFVTGAPIAGVTVDITTAWDVPVPGFPPAACPLLATVTTGPDGRFGPVSVLAGSLFNPSIVLFMVHGADRADTASDNKTCSDSVCTLDHTIAAPAAALVASWRTELAAGGMTDAATNGLIAYLFKNADGTPAAGVTAQIDDNFAPRDLRAGEEVRYLAGDRSAVAAAGQRTTTDSGVALIGLAAVEADSYVAGRRSTQTWPATGCLMQPGWIFLEDRTVSP
jgi:hypothetical protein